jgi:hypothetical protein
MSKIAYLIGTSHIFQIGGKDCAIEHSVEFGELLREVCTGYSISTISEEVNDEGLEKYNAKYSVGAQIALELDLNHLACDPSTQQRLQEGIEERGFVLISAKMNGLDDEEANRLVTIEDIKREKYWYKVIDQNAVYPVVFICGANHTSRFGELLTSNGINVQILDQDWAPNIGN